MIQAIEAFSHINDVKTDILLTESKEYTEWLIERVLHFNNTIIYCVGGDGTLNYIVNAISKNNIENLIIQAIPAGTGNDFCRTLYGNKIPNIKKLLESKNIKEIDLIDINNEKLAVNSVSIGLDVRVLEKVEQYRSKNKGQSNYYNKAIIDTILENPSYNANIFVDGIQLEKQEDKTLVAICNGGFYGNGKQISPNSKIDDGLLDIISSQSMNRPELILLLSKLKLNASHLESDKVLNYSTQEVEIHNNKEDIVYQADGELDKTKRLTLSCKPRGLTIKY